MDYKEYLDEGMYDNLQQDAKKVQQLQKKALVKKANDLAKASTGKFTVARQAAKEKYRLAKKAISQMQEPKTDDEILKIAGLESVDMNQEDIINEQQFLESSNFINYLVKTANITKDKAEDIWKKATKSFEKTDKKVKDKYKYIAGIAKKIANINEDEAMTVPNMVVGSALNTTQSIGGMYAAKLGEVPNYNNPGKYKPITKNLFRRNIKKKRRKVNESDENVNNYLDNLFE